LTPLPASESRPTKGGSF